MTDSPIQSVDGAVEAITKSLIGASGEKETGLSLATKATIRNGIVSLLHSLKGEMEATRQPIESATDVMYKPLLKERNLVRTGQNTAIDEMVALVEKRMV